MPLSTTIEWFTTLRKSSILFGVYSVCLFIGCASVLGALWALATASESASHVILVPFVTLGLVYQNRRAVFSSVRPDWPSGSVVILTGALLWWLSSTLTLSVAAFAILWVGGFVLCYGREACREAIFPLLFLAFMIPIPQSLLDGTVQVLKSGSTEAVAALFTLTGTPYYRDGFVFSLPAFVIEIADECSGIRSSIALLITSVLAGHMFLRSQWTKLLLVLLVVPVAILKNGIRIVSLSLLATYVNPEFLTGQLHQDGGIVFFLLSLAILAPVLGLLRRADNRLVSASLPQELA